MPKVIDPTPEDGRYVHGCYEATRTLAFPPKARSVTGMRRRVTNILWAAVETRGIPAEFAVPCIKAAQGAAGDVFWAERQLRTNPKLRDRGGDLDPENTSTRWVLEWKRKRELDVVAIVKELGFNKSFERDVMATIYNAATAHQQPQSSTEVPEVPEGEQRSNGDPMASEGMPMTEPAATGQGEAT